MTHPNRRLRSWLCMIAVLVTGTGVGPCKVGNPPAPPESPALGVSVIGDANGDGRFDGADALYARDVIDDGGVPAQLAYLSDVASPCEGFVDHDDYVRLREAADALALGRPTPSDCHDEAFIGDETDAPRPAPEDMLPPRPPTLDEQFEAVAALVPEFGGAYVGTNGNVQVVLTAADRLNDAIDALIQVFGVDGLPHDVFEAVDGRFGFGELQAARVEARQLLAAPGVVSVDVNEVENQVFIGVEDLGLVPQIEDALDAAGVDLAMVEIVEEQAPSNDNAWGGEEIFRDLFDGSGIPCTLGFAAKHATELGFVTNAHCGAVTGTPESSYLDTNGANLGIETAEASVFTQAQDPTCPLGAQCMHADVTFVTLDPGVQGARGRITRYNGGGFYEIVQETNFSFAGQLVSKSGRTTFETAGTITATCVDVKPTTNITKLCQDRTDYDADNGDSGSPVFRILAGTDVELHGLHWGSNDDAPIAYFSPMHQIHYELAPLYSLIPTIGNEPPTFDLLDPDDGDSVVGSLVATTFKGFFWDFEDGFGCPTCEVVWSSSVAGYLGTTQATSPWVIDTFLLSGGVKQKIIATARDSKGDETKQAVWLYGGTSVPTVSVLEPFEGQQLWKGATYMYEGTSFDPDFFGPLPCQDAMDWTLPPGSTNKSGCSAENTISQTGNYSVTLTGTKPGTSVSVSDTVGFQVVEPPQNVGPHVAIVRPGDGVGWKATSEQLLKGRVQDFDEAGPVDYEWVIKFDNQEIVIDGGTMPNHEYTTFLWPIEDYFYVPPEDPMEAQGKHPVGCGGTTVEIELRGTDADDMTGQDSTTVVIKGPPC